MILERAENFFVSKVMLLFSLIYNGGVFILEDLMKLDDAIKTLALINGLLTMVIYIKTIRRKK